jgi:uncharacterized protein (TIGR02147 family)
MRLVQIAKPNIYQYVDYRKFLSDYYSENKQRNSAFSFRFFGKQTGMKSFNYLKLVFEGKRRLTETFFQPFCKAMKLNSAEQAYFHALIKFNEEKNAREKESLLLELISLRPKTDTFILDNARMRLCTEWYYIPLLELTESEDFQPNPEWISRQLGISTAKIKKALRELVKLEMLDEKNGSYRKAKHIAYTQDEVSNLLIKIYHRKNLERASQLVLDQEVSEREFQSITFSVDAEKLQTLKGMVKSFKDHVLDFLEAPRAKGKQLYQLNVQMFRVAPVNVREKDHKVYQ